MAVPLTLELVDGSGQWPAFFSSMVLTVFIGGMVALASAGGVGERLSTRQIFLLTTGVWVALPVFGGLPLFFGATQATPTDAFFEAMSGLTTTGSTVISGLDDLPRGLLLWRSMLNWFGGIGIIVVAMVFMPELRIGGMQIFRTESFDTRGKILPHAAAIARQITVIYVALTVACAVIYFALGLPGFEAVNHALTTVSTGGFSTTDASFGAFKGTPEIAASVFMILASLPFVRFVQLVAGTARPLLRDPQIHAFGGAILLVAALLTIATANHVGDARPPLEEIVFNVASIMSGTGYSSVDYQAWGAFAMVLFFFIGLVGGCAGSTCCSAKIFRYQILLSAVVAQVRRIHSPNGLFAARFEGRKVSDEVLSSVMAFFVLFVVTIGVMSVLLSMTGLDLVTAVSGAATAVANIGPGLGPEIGPVGNFSGLNDIAKWLLIFGMLLGRLELMAVYVLFTRAFWRT